MQNTLAARYMRPYGPMHKFFYYRSPLKQMIIMAVLASIVLCSMPELVYADTPAYDPVFYYYHSDHLGSSSIMTDRNGTLVQQYGYTAFGKERYQNNTLAFNVTSRYTGQKLDDETGLYFYNSRYYDPEIGRFIQSDTIVPSADTSQALNRYAYVKNNPLNFTDPSGHGWFSKLWKKIKPWVGTIVGVACMFVPGMQWYTAAVIAAGVSTAVNGGTFKDFAIGASIALATGGIMKGTGADSFLGGLTSDKIMNRAITGAVAGSIGGAATSAVYGQNIGEGALQGAAYGAATAVAVGGVVDAISDGQLYASAPDGTMEVGGMLYPVSPSGSVTDVPIMGANEYDTFFPMQDTTIRKCIHPRDRYRVHYDMTEMVQTHFGIGVLGDTNLNTIIRGAIHSVNKWRNSGLWANRVNFRNLDTPFHKSLISHWEYHGVIYDSSEVNYIGIGHGYARAGVNRTIGAIVTAARKEICYGHEASPGTMFWQRKGYTEYNERAGW